MSSKEARPRRHLGTVSQPIAKQVSHLLWRNIGVTALPLTAALGPYLLPIPVGGVTFYAYRTLVLLLSAMSLLLFRRLGWWNVPVARTYALLGIFWVFWAAVSALGAPAIDRALLEVAALGFGFVTALTLLQLRSYELSALHALRRGWVLAFIATFAIAAWELSTGQHLPSSAVQRAEPGQLQGIVIATFGNQNNYAAFLLLAAPFLLWSYTGARSRWTKLFYTLCLLVLPVLLFVTASRVSLLGLMSEAVVLWVVAPRHRSRILIYLVLLGGTGLIVIQLLGLGGRMLYELSTMIGGGGIGGGGSISKRWNLMLAGLWMVAESFGLGVGPGGFEALLRQRVVPFDTGGLVNPHNFWIEVVSQYGLPVFGAFLLWSLYMAQQVLRRRRRTWLDPERLETRSVTDTILVALGGYVFAAVANSTYMVQSTNWMFWASIVVMATYLWKKRPVGVLSSVEAQGRGGTSSGEDGDDYA